MKLSHLIAVAQEVLAAQGDMEVTVFELSNQPNLTVKGVVVATGNLRDGHGVTRGLQPQFCLLP